ncbi:hypothetical protein HY385_02440 [Candidatus Daviesbacteria bacterium]|nr:hypothetical protein [Candidatus Daviesbacteria bacterium]
MENQAATSISSKFPPNRIFLAVLVLAIVLGAVTGYLLVNPTKADQPAPVKNPKSAQQDTRTFRDFAEGVIQKRPEPKNGDDYIEGTHLLVREGAVPVALTSSVTDLSQYEGKKVKVYGETQKAIKEGWLMDVGKVEVQ